jgi:tripartite-type tricarboxylate transporter receptor subunit TctC
MPMSASRRLILAALAAAFATPAFAQSYPAKPIRVIVPYPAGGTTDVLARAVGERLSAAWGRPVVIDNKSGAGGTIGTAEAAKAAPDGYTLVLGNNQTHAMNATLFEKVPFDLAKDFAPVAYVASSRHVVVVNEKSPAKSLADLVALGKKQRLTFASSSLGSASHLISEALRVKAGMEATHVPYRGANPATLALLSGEVDFYTATYASVAQHIDSGKLRPLAIGGPARIAKIGAVPTLGEAGYPDLNADAWFGFYAPAGVPADIVAKLNGGIGAALKEPAVAENLRKIGFEPATMSVAEFAAFHAAELKRWSQIIALVGVKLKE